MKNLLAACVVLLGIVSGNLWYNLRSARQQIAALQEQLGQAEPAVARSEQVQAPPPPIPAPAAPPVAVQLSEPQPFRPAARPASASPVALPSLNRPLTASTVEGRREEALIQSDKTATARVNLWNTTFNFTPEQLEALNAAAKAELRRETEESLQIDSSTGPMDAQTAARIKVESVTRKYDTLVRIHERMTPQLTPEQSTNMRAMFDRWLRNNMARARAEQQAIMSGN